MKRHSNSTMALIVPMLAVLLACLTSNATAEVIDAKHTDLLNKADASGKSNSVVKNEDDVPEGLTGSQWKGIRRAYEQHRHAAVAVDGEFRARNPGQQWLTHFDGRGFIVKPDVAGWRWGLQLQSYGFPDHQRTVSGQAKMTAKDDRVTYDWQDGLQEWFVNDRSGLEHGFTLDSRPPGSGDTQLDTDDPKLGASDWLELRMTVRGSLRAKAHADGQSVSFMNQQGSTVINYAGLKVWDADH